MDVQQSRQRRGRDESGADRLLDELSHLTHEVRSKLPLGLRAFRR